MDKAKRAIVVTSRALSFSIRRADILVEERNDVEAVPARRSRLSDREPHSGKRSALLTQTPSVDKQATQHESEGKCLVCEEPIRSVRAKYCSTECRRKAYETSAGGVERRKRYRESERGKSSQQHYNASDRGVERGLRLRLAKAGPASKSADGKAASTVEGERRVKLRNDYSRLFRIATEKLQAGKREIRAQRATEQITAAQASQFRRAMNEEFQESLIQLRQHPYWIEFVVPKKS